MRRCLRRGARMTSGDSRSTGTPVRRGALGTRPPPSSSGSGGGSRADADPVGTASRRADIQGLRAVAALMVVAYHAGMPLPGGFVGVDVFFVVSGFVITAMLRREWAWTGRIRFGRLPRAAVQTPEPCFGADGGRHRRGLGSGAVPLSSPNRRPREPGSAMLLAADFVIAETT